MPNGGASPGRDCRHRHGLPSRVPSNTRHMHSYASLSRLQPTGALFRPCCGLLRAWAQGPANKSNTEGLWCVMNSALLGLIHTEVYAHLAIASRSRSASSLQRPCGLRSALLLSWGPANNGKQAAPGCEMMDSCSRFLMLMPMPCNRCCRLSHGMHMY